MALKFRDIRDLFQVRPNRRVRIRDCATHWKGTGDLRDLAKDDLKAEAQAFLSKNLEALADAQERLYATGRHSLLIVLQAMDAAGKDGIIKHVMSGVNPQGCEVFSFKRPSDEELAHNYLWRYTKALPERGRIGIFNRSYYEEVLVVRVHQEILERQRLPPGKRNEKFWQARYQDINNLEEHLARNGTVVLKFFLHVSKGEQKRRLLDRLEDPSKHWKFSVADLAERKCWKDYQQAFEEMLNHTSTKHAPWWVIPADNKWLARVLVASITTRTIEELDLQMPEMSEQQKRALMQAKRQLLAE
ncbi:MAG TPA: polyphosphate kinase 2 family protein [Vicinamibacterales bacterium]|jgi:PPK2 family polyphosphate:nucleotide phosphotransferase